MATYEFQCPACGAVGTTYRPMARSEEPLFCDGTAIADSPDEKFDDAQHEWTEMTRLVSLFHTHVPGGTRNIGR